MTPTKTKHLNETSRVELLVDEAAPLPSERAESMARLYSWHPWYKFNDHQYPDREALDTAMRSDADLAPALVRNLYMVPPPPNDYHISLRMGGPGPADEGVAEGEEVIGAVVLFRSELESEGLDAGDADAVAAMAKTEVDLWQKFCNAQVYCLFFKTLDETGVAAEHDLQSVGGIYDISDSNLDDELLDFLPDTLHDDIRRTTWQQRT